MIECDGYLTTEGECLEAYVPLVPMPIVSDQVDELANTGIGPELGLVVFAGVLVSLGLGLLRWSVDRRSVGHD